MATLNPNLREFWETRELECGTPVRFRTLYGGRMSSKSHDAAGIAIARANHHKENFLCMRMFQNRIADSVYSLLKDKIWDFGLQDMFDVQADCIKHKYNGSVFKFYGIARNIDEIKSYEGATVAWIEEAHNLTEEMFKIIRPTVMRNEGAEMWFTFNPRYAQDYVYRRLVKNPPKGSLVRKINYYENGFLTQSALDDIRAEFNEDYELANHVYNGVPLEDDEGVIIKRSWIEACVDAHKKVKPTDGRWTGRKAIGFDVADDGDDLNANAGMNGSVLVLIEEWKGGEDELLTSTRRTISNAKSINADTIGYDSIGVGASTGAHLKEDKWNNHYKFNAGAKVVDPDKKYKKTKIENKDYFANLKAQAWWLLADRCRNTYNAIKKGYEFEAHELFSINSATIDSKTLEKLKDELCTPRRNFDVGGKVKVESKKELKKREIKSPNCADAVVIVSAHTSLYKPSMDDIN